MYSLLKCQHIFVSYIYVAYEALGIRIIVRFQFLAIKSTANNWGIGLKVS